MYMRHPQKRKSICSGDVLYWASLVLLAITSLGTVVALQKARKEVQHLSFRLEEAGTATASFTHRISLPDCSTENFN